MKKSEVLFILVLVLLPFLAVSVPAAASNGLALSKVDTTATAQSFTRRAVENDFDGDGRSDIGCYYAPLGKWYVFKSKEGFFETAFGYAGTIPITGDFDGDGRSDIGCYYPPLGKWYVFKSKEGFLEAAFGYAGTIPITGDFDGDGKCDFGCYYPPLGKWYVFKSKEGFFETQFGYSTTRPVTGDFDGDGRCDIGCFDSFTATWYLFKSTEGFQEIDFGHSGTVPFTGDFDGDGRADIGCYHAYSGTWDVRRSTEGDWETQFGYSGTVPILGRNVIQRSMAELAGHYVWAHFTFIYDDGAVVTDADVPVVWSGEMNINANGSIWLNQMVDGQNFPKTMQATVTDNNTIRVLQSSVDCPHDWLFEFDGTSLTTYFITGTCGKDYTEIGSWVRTR